MVQCGKEGVGRVIDDSVGTYDGMIGCVQRGESTTMQQFVRPDSTPFEPGIFVTSSYFADTPRIYSMRPKRPSSKTVDILYLWTNFSLQTWMYLISILTLTTILFILLNHTFMPTENPIRYVLYQSSYWLWKYFLLTLKRFDVMHTSALSLAVLMTSIAISILYAYHMVLMNTLSSDLTVPVATQSIDSLHDLLYEPQFQNVTPVILRALNMLNLLINARKGTDEYFLYQRILADPNNTIIDVDLSNIDAGYVMGKVMQLVRDAANGLSVFIENSYYISLVIKRGACSFDPENSSLILETKEIISPSPLLMLVSKNVTPDILELLQYRIYTTSEMGVHVGLFRTRLPRFFEAFLGKPDKHVEAIVCTEKFDHTFSEPLDLPWQPFDVTPFERLGGICIGLILLAFVVLIFEIVWFAQEIMSTKRRVASNKVIFERRKRVPFPPRRILVPNSGAYPLDLHYCNKHAPIPDRANLERQLNERCKPLHPAIADFISTHE